MIDHGQTLTLAAAALDWPLSAQERREVKSHLDHCGACRVAAAQMRDDAAAIQALPKADAPAALRLRVLGAAGRLTPSRGTTRWPLLAAAALLLAGLLGSMFAVGALRPTPEPTDAPIALPPVEPSADPSGAIPLESVAPAAGPEWTSSGAGLAEDASLGAVAATRGGLVAVGPDAGIARAWTSVDGTRWIPRDLPGGEFAEVYDVAAGPGMIVAVGNVPSSRAAVWTSTDGSTWTRAPESPAFVGGSMYDVTVTPAGILAIGRDRAWFSSDSKAWDVVLEGAVFTDATSWREGFAIVGCANGDELRCVEPGLWLSRDGRVWSREPPAAGQGSSRLAQVVAFGDGLVALPDHDSPAGVWQSADGLRWTQAADSSVFEGARPALLIAAGPGLVAVGGPEEGGAGRVGVWASSDVAEWTAARDTSAFGEVAEVFDAAATADRLFVVGRKQIAEDGRAEITIWISPPE
jgi:hypothetical protein